MGSTGSFTSRTKSRFNNPTERLHYIRRINPEQLLKLGVYLSEKATGYWSAHLQLSCKETENPKRSSCVNRGLLPALAGRCGNPGDTVFLCRAGCCGDRRRGSVRVEVTKEVVVTRAPAGLLLNWRAAAFWLDTGTVTGMEKVGCGTVDWQRYKKRTALKTWPVFTSIYIHIWMNRWSVSHQQQSEQAWRWQTQSQHKPTTPGRVLSKMRWNKGKYS